MIVMKKETKKIGEGFNFRTFVELILIMAQGTIEIKISPTKIGLLA